MSYKHVISLILSGLVVVFIVQNAMAVEVRFLFWTFALSQALLIFFVLAIGVVIGWLSRDPVFHRKDQQ